MTAAAAAWRILAAAVLFLAAIFFLAVLAMAGAALLGARFLAAYAIILSLAAATLLTASAYSVFFGAPFVPTDAQNVEEMIRLAGVRPGEKLVDLGSGDGRILIAAARAGARAEGWEINPYLWLWSQLKIRRAGLGGAARAHLGSYWAENFADADVVTLFLIDKQMERMEKKLLAELPPDGRVISYVFKFPNWAIAGRSDKGVYLYRRADVAGGSNNVNES